MTVNPKEDLTVAEERRMRKVLYKKSINTTSKFKAHDENNECRIGDTVRIVETRPLSRDKRWRVEKIVARQN